MVYVPPSGWLERIDEPRDELTEVRARFHRSLDCERIRRPDALTAVDRPYHAPRCRACAPE